MVESKARKATAQKTSAGPEVTADEEKPKRRRAAARPAGPPQAAPAADEAAPPKRTRATTRKAAESDPGVGEQPAAAARARAPRAAKETDAAESPRATKATKAAKAAKATKATKVPPSETPPGTAVPVSPIAAIFVPPQVTPAPDGEKAPVRRRSRAKASDDAVEAASADGGAAGEQGPAADDDDAAGPRRRRRRGGRGRRRRGEGDEPETDGDDAGEVAASSDSDEDDQDEDDEDDGSGTGRRRRRRRRRRGSDGDQPSADDPPNTVVRVREPRQRQDSGDDVGSVRGSTRLEAKKQRRREGREAGRRRAPILTEAEFLARREEVVRVMAVRQEGERTQIAVLEDGILVEHYVTRGAASSMVGNVYLGRVQNVLPSMEAAFVDIGRGRNAVLYAGEVNWDAAGLDGQPKRIEFALKSGDPVLVQVTKDPVGQKGARLTSQISLAGRFLVYVPDGSMTGISRKLPDSERSRLKSVLKRVVPDEAGVIVRTAAEGAPEHALVQDVERLQAQWTEILAKSTSATPPALLYAEPDLAIKVVRDLFNEDVSALVVSGAQAWDSVQGYVAAVAPDLVDRLQHWTEPKDLFAEYRVDEQLAKALDRKVWLPSGGSLVIDRTEAMTVIDVNTGKFTGQGGNLEQTVTKNNLEAAEEIVRQLRLRDVGGIVVVDFIDMVLESNRELVLRRLVECLGRDRTKHQVAEVTSLGLVQMTRKRIGTGLLESFSSPCEACSGRGVRIALHGEHDHEISPKHRRPPNAVDPADVAARMFDQHAEEAERTDVHEDDAWLDQASASLEVRADDDVPPREVDDDSDSAITASTDGGGPDIHSTETGAARGRGWWRGR